MSRLSVRYPAYEGDISQLQQLTELARTQDHPVIRERISACLKLLEPLLRQQRNDVRVCSYLDGIVDQARRAIGEPVTALHIFEPQETDVEGERDEAVA